MRRRLEVARDLLGWWAAWGVFAVLVLVSLQQVAAETWRLRRARR